MTEPASQDDALQEYRRTLIELEQQSQLEYDRTVLTLSGGALGVSFAFVKDFLGSARPCLPRVLIWAWICWVVSLTATLISHYLSGLAIRKAIEQVDQRTIGLERAGGYYDRGLLWLNAAGGLLFVAGLLLMGWFVSANMR